MLGGLFLAVYAAERGVFTPPLRIAAAVIAGALMLAASEWIRRRPNSPTGRHLLASSVSAGAGAATLYGGVWAAFALYRLIPFEAAVVMVAAVSLGLLALALLHGEALAILALAGAFAAPAITGLGLWTPIGLESYLVVIALTAAAVATTRRWGYAGLAGLLGASAWSLEALFHDRPADAAILLVLQVAAPFAAVLWRDRDQAPRRDVFAVQPIPALIVSSLFCLPLCDGALGHPGYVAGVLTVCGLAFLGGGIARFARAPAAVFVAPVAAAVLGVVFRSSAGAGIGTASDQALLFAMVGSIAIAGLLFGRSLVVGRLTLVGAGAIGAAILANWIWLWPGGPHPVMNAALPALTALLLAAGGVLLAKGSTNAEDDRPLELWIAANAELAFLTIHAATLYTWAPVVHAALAVALALLAWRLRWRGLAQSSVAGGVVVLATMLRPLFVSDILQGRITPVHLALVTAGAASLLWAASRGLRAREASRNLAETQSTASLLVAACGVFFLLHVVLTGAAGAHHLALLEASLRTLLILATAALLALRPREPQGSVAWWRLILVGAIGVGHAVILQGLALNPWWGLAEPVPGPPFVNFLALAFLAPAVLLWVAGRRAIAGLDWLAPAARTLALAFGFLWVVMELRHLFHGPFMAAGDVGNAESAAYALSLLLAARALFGWSSPTAQDAVRTPMTVAAPPTAWVAIAVSSLGLSLYASPWWGPLGAPLASPLAALLLFTLYLGSAIATISLSRVAGAAGLRALSRAAAGAAAVELFVLLTLLVRWAYRGADMRAAGGEAGAETWTYSAVWAVFGLVCLVVGGVRSSPTVRWLGLVALLGTVAKVLLFDMAHLDGVVRAASFLAVGALLIVGALAARRLNAPAPSDQRQA